MVQTRADNTSPSFKCSQCGAMYTKPEKEGICPVCGYDCTAQNCREVDASDEGY